MLTHSSQPTCLATRISLQSAGSCLNQRTAHHQQLSQSSAAPHATHSSAEADQNFELGSLFWISHEFGPLLPSSQLPTHWQSAAFMPEEHVPTATSVFLLGGAGGMPGDKRSARNALLVLRQLVAVSLLVSHESSKTMDSIPQLVARSSPPSKV